MNVKSTIVAVTLCSPALTAPGETPLAFGPEQGSSLAKSIDMSLDFALEDFSLVVDGEDIGAIMGGFDFSMLIDSSFEVTDEYAEMGDGVPRKLVRTFDRLASDVSVSVISEFGGEDQDIASESDLEGRTVVFTWDDDAQAYTTAFASGEGETDLLEDLTEDMDFRALLPDKDVSVGESWEVPLEELECIAAPGGNVKLLPDTGEEVEDFSEMQEMFEDKFSDLGELFEGQWTCTYLGQSEDDAKLALIGIETTVEASIDLTETLLELVDMVAAEVEEELPDIQVDTADLTFEFEGAGTLAWDQSEGHFASFDLAGDLIFSADLAVSVDVEGESHSAELYLEMSGTLEESAAATE